MRTVLILALNSWQENLRSRFYVLCVAFGGVILYISLVLGMLAADQELRVLLDFGLGAIELLGLAGAVYGATTTILREMETKTIYLILARPVGRGQYLIGRFAGLMLSVLASMAIMSCLHLAILFWKGWTWNPAYLQAFLGAYLKVLVTAALASFLALFSSSVLTALGITAILWTLGHFLPEIRFMTLQGPRGAALPLTALSYFLPDLQLLNYRDRLAAASFAPRELSLAAGLAYAASYAAAWLAAARFLLRKKEF